MRAEDADQSGDVGQLNSDVMIETPSPRERGIEASRIVTPCADEHALDLLETLNGFEQRGHDRGPPGSRLFRFDHAFGRTSHSSM